jgi:hypothetical protein
MMTTGQVTALLQHVKNDAANGVLTVQEIQKGVDFAANLVRVEAIQALDHGSVHGNDSIVNIQIAPGFVIHADVNLSSARDLADVGAMVLGGAMLASSPETGGAAQVPGVLLVLAGAVDFITHNPEVSRPLFNGQDVATAPTVLPPIGFDGVEPEPSGDTDDASFISNAITQTHILGLGTYLQDTFGFGF